MGFEQCNSTLHHSHYVVIKIRLRNNQIVSDRSSFVFNNSADKRTSELEAMTRLKDHEIERLEYMNNYLEMGIKKREEIIKNYFEENCKLKDDNKSMNKLIERLREELKEARESHQAIDLKGIIRYELCLTLQIAPKRNTAKMTLFWTQGGILFKLYQV